MQQLLLSTQISWEKRPPTLSSVQSLPQLGSEQGTHWPAGRKDCCLQCGWFQRSQELSYFEKFMNLSPWAQPILPWTLTHLLGTMGQPSRGAWVYEPMCKSDGTRV